MAHWLLLHPYIVFASIFLNLVVFLLLIGSVITTAQSKRQTPEKKEKEQKEQKEIMDGYGEVFPVVLSEALFVIVPLVVLSFIALFRGQSAVELFASPEWSFAASVLFGQLIVKCVSSALRAGSLGWRFIAGATAVLIVLGLVPSLLTLTLLLITTGHSHNIILNTVQIIWFTLGLLSFFFLGGAFEVMLLRMYLKTRP